MSGEFTIDADFEEPVYSPTCTSCRNINPEKRKACTAFPDGIPLEIWDGRNPHRLPFEGDHGIQYSPIEGPQG